MNALDVVEYAIRYCMTRDSYAFYDGIALAERYWSDLTTATQRDVLEAVGPRDRIAFLNCPKIDAARDLP